MKDDKLYAKVLSVRLISNMNTSLIKALKIQSTYKSIGIITADIDDVTYTALDEATKEADVEVIYGASMYAGAANASTKLAGEVIGILAGPSPEEVKSGLHAALSFIENDGYFLSANDDDSISYYAKTISRTGSYLSKLAHIPQGDPIAYLIAPPTEAIVGIDAALKAADVELKEFFEPPSETNFSGALMTGSQSACLAACSAFSQAVKEVASVPKEL